MSKNLENYIKNLDAKLGLVESLLNRGNFKKALAEIRELENQKVIDDSSAEAGELSYLGAYALDKLGRLNEALSRAKKAYEILRNTEKHRRLAQIQHIMGIIYAHLGELKSAEIQFTDTASTYRRIGDEKGIAGMYNELARISFLRSDYRRAAEYINDALDFCRRTEDTRMAARLQGNLGTILMLEDRWAEAKKSLLLSLEANQALGDDINACRSLLSLGNLSCLTREFGESQRYLEKALSLITESNFVRELAIYNEYRGNLEFARGDFKAAREHFREAIEIGEQIGPASAIMSQAYRLLAQLQAEEGDHQKAMASCEKSLQVSRDIGEKIEEAVVHGILGRVQSEDGHPAAQAKENFDLAVRMMEEMGVKYELTKTYLDMSRCDAFDFREKMKFLGRAEDLARQLDSPYYSAKVHVGFAELFIRSEKPAAAQDFLSKARGVFEQLEEGNDLKALSALEKRLKTPPAASQLSCKNSFDGFSFDDIITRDRTTLDILESIRQIKDLDITILLEGETGTGKDLLAKAIHCSSNRKDKSFVVANCATLPEALFESELFGHKKGAFTGSVADKKGLMDEAHGGTLYLDEIAEVPLPIQVKLLRAIEEKEILRVGEVKPRKVDFRVIAATNRDLDELVKEGKFRSDLFYRLDVMRFKLPPLRKRTGDIPFLVEHFLRKYCASGMREDSDPIPTVHPSTMELLTNYDWPGNVRELENDVQRLLISSRGHNTILPEHLGEGVDKYLNGRSTRPVSLRDQKTQLEKEEIGKALLQANGVKTKAAQQLGMNEALLRYKMKKHGINTPRQEA